MSDEAIAAWRAAPRQTLGGQARYAQTAIEAALMVRLVFHQPLRQTEGLLGSLMDLLGVALPVPDHTTIRDGDASQVGPLLDQTSGPTDTVMADGA